MPHIHTSNDAASKPSHDWSRRPIQAGILVFSQVPKPSRHKSNDIATTDRRPLPNQFLRGQIPGYSTKRLPGLDVLPSDGRAMMRAKAKKSKSTTSFGVDASDRPRTGGATVKRGGFAGSYEESSGRIGTARAIVAATGIRL